MRTSASVAVGLVAFVALAAAQDRRPGARTPSTSTVWDGVYTDQQADRGQQMYRRTCAKCHLSDLTGGEHSGGADGEVPPPLVGPEFIEHWNDRSLSELFLAIKRGMPLDTPGALPAPAYADLLGFLLKMNDMPAGTRELPSDPASIEAIRITPRP